MSDKLTIFGLIGYRSVLQTKIQISSSTTLLLIRCFSGGWSPETGWVTDVLVYRPEDSRWEKVRRVPHFDIDTESLCYNSKGWGSADGQRQSCGPGCRRVGRTYP